MILPLMVSMLVSGATVAQADAPPKTPADAVALLKKGNLRATQAGYEYHATMPLDRSQLAAGQAPYAIVLGCADSRVSPDLIFDEPAGRLFVVRVAGNIAEMSSLASVQYGVHVLHAKAIVVLGHTSCGAVKTALAPMADRSGLTAPLRYLIAHIHTGPKSTEKAAIIANVQYQENLLKKDPLLKQYIAKKQLVVVGGYYDIATGKVTLLP